MASERIQRQINRLLDEIEDAVARRNWDIVRERSKPGRMGQRCRFSIAVTLETPMQSETMRPEDARPIA